MVHLQCTYFLLKIHFYDKHLDFYMGFYVQQSVLDKRAVEFSDSQPH